MRVQWVHPSWRDLVIDHLAADEEARAHFLSCCSAHGVLLALSSGGGTQGERQLPLLAGDADWDTLTDRVHHLAPELSVIELQAVLDDLARAIATVEEPMTRVEALALARTLLKRLAQLWDASAAPLSLPALEAWLTLASALPDDPPRPAPPALGRTWSTLLPRRASGLGDRDELEQLVDWLTLAVLLAEHSRDDLRALRLDDHVHVVISFLNAVDRDLGQLDPACEDHVRRALDLILALGPELSSLPSGFFGRLHDIRAAVGAATPRAVSPPPLDEQPGWRHFDVGRVLEDL